MSFNKRVTFQINAKDNASLKFKSLKGNISKINKETGTFTNKLSSFGSKFSGVASMIKTASKVAVIGIAGITATAAIMIKKTTDAFVQMENSMIGLGTVARAFNQDIDKTKQAARDLAADGLMSVADAANSLKNLLGAGFNLDEAIKLMNGFKDSAAFNRQGTLAFGEAIEGATQGIKNQNSILVDNAGITKNLSIILKEAGYSIQDLGNVQSDANVRAALYNGLLKEMSVFQGDAAKASDTLGGSISQTKTSIFNMKALIGEQFAPVVKLINQRIREFAGSLSYTDENGVQKLRPEVEKLIQTIADGLVKTLNKIIEVGSQWVENMGGSDGIMEKLQKLFDVIVNDVIPAIRLLAKAVSTAVSIMVAVLGAYEKAFEDVFYVMFRLIDLAKKGWSKFKDAFSNSMQGVKQIFFSVWDSIKSGLVSGINYFIEKINNLIGKANKVPGVDIGKIEKIGSRAEGGSVTQGKPYIVGERGPEMFVPNQSGTIVPNNQMGPTFNFNFQGATITNEEELINKITNGLNRQLELAQNGIA